jgi:hypothetical protein
MEKEIASNENWTIIPQETEQKYPPTHATPSIKKTILKYHTTKERPWLHTFLPVMDTINAYRITSMYMWLPPPDTQTPPARMQTLQH